MNQKFQLSAAQQMLLDFLSQQRTFRFNELTTQVEVSEDGSQFKPLTEHLLNTLYLETQAEGLEVKLTDLRILLNSEHTPSFHPFRSFMEALPAWDGEDRLTGLAERVSKDPVWVMGFKRWMLGLAAQWQGKELAYGNNLAPILVSRKQGLRKSSFCKLLMPERLLQYYTDKYDLNAASKAEQKMAFYGLINLDEFDRYSDRQHATLKNLMQLTALTFRRAYFVHATHYARMSSFIATSNQKELLTDPTGSRRFLCVEVTEEIDCSPLQHEQLFAQLASMLAAGERHWFTKEEEALIQKNNEPFQKRDEVENVVLRLFKVPQEYDEVSFVSSSEIFRNLTKCYPTEMKGMSMTKLGKTLFALGFEKKHSNQGSFYKTARAA